VHDDLENFERAIHHWEVAISYFEKTQPPSSVLIAALSNNIAYLKKSLGDLDGAETSLLVALEIFHRELGPDDDETASVCNNLGALYHQVGQYEQAREMHLMALEARRKLYGENHPDTAQSYNNLALALGETGDPELAKEHFECAIGALSQCGADIQHELVSVSENYMQFLQESEDHQSSEKVAARVQQTLSQWA
jgi:tetratricopeptide (TPR) repeat protein